MQLELTHTRFGNNDNDNNNYGKMNVGVNAAKVNPHRLWKQRQRQQQLRQDDVGDEEVSSMGIVIDTFWTSTTKNTIATAVETATMTYHIQSF